MNFQTNLDMIEWRVHLASSPEKVFLMLSTDEGRRSFWAESAIENNGTIQFHFPNGQKWDAKIIDNVPPQRFSLIYYGGSLTTFILQNDSHGGTDLTLQDKVLDTTSVTEIIAGWVSVLMALKAAVDYNVDLRNHDKSRTWQHGYVEN